MKRKEGRWELRWERNVLQSSSLLKTANVSSTYRKYANGLLAKVKSFSSWQPTKMFANAGPNGDPMATPSICRYMLLKLNSTEEVASWINSTKMSRGNDGCGKTLLLYRVSAQICMVSASGTLVKRLEMSKEQRKTEEGENVKFMTSFTKIKESDTQLTDRS